MIGEDPLDLGGQFAFVTGAGQGAGRAIALALARHNAGGVAVNDFVAERAEVGEEREALFAVTIPEERGSFRRFCELIGEQPGGPRSVTEFN